jgi:hypothetical protein
LTSKPILMNFFALCDLDDAINLMLGSCNFSLFSFFSFFFSESAVTRRIYVSINRAHFGFDRIKGFCSAKGRNWSLLIFIQYCPKALSSATAPTCYKVYIVDLNCCIFVLNIAVSCRCMFSANSNYSVLFVDTLLILILQDKTHIYSG